MELDRRHIPVDVLNDIFSHLDSRSLAQVSRVNRLFHSLATSPRFWKDAYLLRWTTGNPKKELERGAAQARRNYHAASIEAWARESRRLAQVTDDQPSPFRLFQAYHESHMTADATPNYHRLFSERIRIDGKVLELLYSQVEATHSRIPAAQKLLNCFGADAKDILNAVIESQTSGIDQHYYRISAYDFHQPTTMRSASHHLVLLHHARELLEHIQRSEAMEAFKLYDPQVQTVADPYQVEKAVCHLSMFRGGEFYKIQHQLDLLAAACDLYIQSRASDLSPDPVKRARPLAFLICEFLAENGFQGARSHRFQDLDNRKLLHCHPTLGHIFVSSPLSFFADFLHMCLKTNRETLPLSLTTIFCAIANRLGLRASLCNFPMRIFAVVIPEGPWLAAHQVTTAQEATAPYSKRDSRFWIDVSEYTAAASRSDEIDYVRANPPVLAYKDLVNANPETGYVYLLPASANTIVVRACRNIVASVQRAQPPLRGPAAWDDDDLDHSDPASESGPSSEMRADQTFLKLSRGWVMESERHATYGSGDVVPENLSAWTLARRWRETSLDTLGVSFQQWLSIRRDWTDRHLPPARDWSEHDRQAAMYAAANGFIRLSSELGDRGADWIAGLVQSYFPLDADLIRRDFIGVSRYQNRAEDHSDSGSDSSFESDSFSSREERRRTYVRNPQVQMMLRTMLDDVRNKDREPPRVNRRPASAEDAVDYRVGTLFRHRRFGYVACILGWDTECNAPEDWILNMGVDRLPGRGSRSGRHQPFYHSQVADGTRRYVAEVNIEPLSDMSDEVDTLLRLRGLGEYFRCFDQRTRRLRRNDECRAMFPDDVSDAEDDSESAVA